MEDLWNRSSINSDLIDDIAPDTYSPLYTKKSMEKNVIRIDELMRFFLSFLSGKMYI